MKKLDEKRFKEIVVQESTMNLSPREIYQVFAGTCIWGGDDGRTYLGTKYDLYYECDDRRKSLRYRWVLLLRWLKIALNYKGEKSFYIKRLYWIESAMYLYRALERQLKSTDNILQMEENISIRYSKEDKLFIVGGIIGGTFKHFCQAIKFIEDSKEDENS